MASGSGHIMRLFALAQWAVESNIKITFAYKKCLSNLLKKLEKEQFHAVQFQDPLSNKQIMAHNPTHIVIDDYSLSNKEWALLDKLPIFKIVFDDSQDQNPILADLIINSSPFASLMDYKRRAPNAYYCLGPKFTLLRQEFLDIIPSIPKIEERKQILITMGGTDVLGLTLPLCTHFLKHYPNINIVALVGTEHSLQLPFLEELASRNSKLNLYVNPKNVAEIMAASSLAISAAGTTLNELACMKTPTLALIVADNQTILLNSTQNEAGFKVFDFRKFNYLDPNRANKIITNLCFSAYKLFCHEGEKTKFKLLALKTVDIKGGLNIVNQIISKLN